MSARDAARGYLARGFAPIPIPAGEKGPRLPGWQKLQVTPDAIDDVFSLNSNVGLLLGTPSGGLVDVDLDAPEAVKLAPYFLPPTAMIHGRSSKPQSHFWYRVFEAAATKQLKDIDGTSLVELRANGGQTVVPPSIHPSGEEIEWYADGVPDEVEYSLLSERVHRLAGAVLLVRHYPKQGGRQDLAMALAGALSRAQWKTPDIRDFIETIAAQASDEEASKRASTVERTVEALRLGRPATGWPRVAEILGKQVADKVRDFLGIVSNEGPGDEPARGRTGRESQLAAILEIAREGELFHSTQKEAFTLLEKDGHKESWPIKGSGFQSWITRRMYEVTGQACKSQNLKDAIDLLAVQALHEGPQHRVYLRVGRFADKIYLDLGTPDWEVLEIDADGWRVIADSPVHFYRPSDFGQLPHPKACADILYFQELLNTENDDDLSLMLSWVASTLRPDGPFPVLILQGEAGSAKSTTARTLRRLVDPCEVTLRSMPGSERDIMIAGRNNWIIPWDNLSGMSDWQSDIACRISTGSGFATRALFQDLDEVLISLQRPMLLNGIDDIAVRPDLIDRAIVLTLPVIPDNARQDEETYWRKFSQLHPYLLGYLASAVSTGLRNFQRTKLPVSPRMMDFCRWVTAMEGALGWPAGGFSKALTRNRSNALQVGADASPVASEIIRLMSRAPSWLGTATELHEALSNSADSSLVRSRYWPKDATRLAGQLRRCAPALRETGIAIEYQRGADRERRRTIQITREPDGSVRTVQRPPELPPRPDRPEPLLSSQAQSAVTPLVAAPKADAVDGADAGKQSDGAQAKERTWLQRLVEPVSRRRKP